MSARDGDENPRDRDELVEAALTAWRPRTPDGLILPHPAWCDLSEADRQQVFAETLRARALEGWLDPDGLSSTGKAVMGRIVRAVILGPKE